MLGRLCARAPMARPRNLLILSIATIAILGILLIEQKFAPKPTPEQLEQQRQKRQAEAAKAKEIESQRRLAQWEAEKQAKRAEEARKVDNWYANESQYSCEMDLEEKLRDPGSYKRDGQFITTDDDGSKKVIAWKFRAKNGFGGFNVGTALCSVSKENGGTVKTETIAE
jgi:hypothetical protein